MIVGLMITTQLTSLTTIRSGERSGEHIDEGPATATRALLPLHSRARHPCPSSTCCSPFFVLDNEKLPPFSGCFPDPQDRSHSRLHHSSSPASACTQGLLYHLSPSCSPCPGDRPLGPTVPSTSCSPTAHSTARAYIHCRRRRPAASLGTAHAHQTGTVPGPSHAELSVTSRTTDTPMFLHVETHIVTVAPAHGNAASFAHGS